jgi:RNA polymerase sigma-70 factor (ECF subfamily)
MDATRFKSLVLPLSGRLLHFARFMLKDHGEAEDAVQEICLKLWKIRDSLERYDSLEAFAMKVLKNWCLDRLKARKPVYIAQYHAGYDNAAEEADPYKQAEKADHKNLLMRILDKLPEQQRIIIQLREFQGLEFEDIGEIMDMHVNAVRVCLFRARNKIREELIKYDNYASRRTQNAADKIL